MKVLHIETGRHLYGGALQVRYLLEGLSASGIDSLLVCPRGSEIAHAAQPFAKVLETPIAGDFDPRLLVRLRQAIRSEKPDLVHVHSRRGADLWGGIAARLEGSPAILTRRVDNPEARWLAKTKYGMYRKVVTISEGIRQVLLSEGVSPEKLICIPSAVDYSVWQNPCDQDWFRHEFSFQPGDKVVGVIAQLIPRKGHRFLLEAAPSILEKRPETRFLFLGQGPSRDDLERQCREAGLTEKVIFAGFRKDLQRILPCLDLVVHPALMEGLGVSLLQASACGVPIVAARAGGIPEIVRDGENGFLVEPGRAEELVEPVTKVLQYPSLAARMGNSGREIVIRYFSTESMVREYRRLYSLL